MVKLAYVIRHIMFEDLGNFERILEENGFYIQYIEAGFDDIESISKTSCDLLIVLGGPISANAINDYPWLETEVRLIKNRLELRKPIIGICLGAQLISKALGYKVFPCEQKEIGWGKIKISDAGRIHPINVLTDALVFHWHGEAFEVPFEATLLASTDVCNQAFSIANYCLALQFHPEVVKKKLELWYSGHALEINTTSYINIHALRADAEKYTKKLEEKSKNFWCGVLNDMNLIF